MTNRIKAQRTVLKNGLTVLTERMPGFNTVSIGVWVRVGTRYERSSEAGISHFLEHMVFKGTEKRNAAQIIREIERVGGEFNAFTAREYTCFHINVLPRDLEVAMEVLSDILMGSTFDALEFEREKKVILQEIAMVEDSPEEIAHDLHFELMYGKTRFGRSILGTASSVRKMRRGDLLRYFRKHYRPDNMIVSVAGDVSKARVLKGLGPLTKRQWPGRPPRRLSKREEGFEPVKGIREGLWWVSRHVEQAHVVWAVDCPKITSRDQDALVLLASYLGGGMSSYLFQEVREKHGLAYSVYSGLNTFSDSGTFYVYAATSSRDVPKCIELIEAAAMRLCSEKLSPEALLEEKESLKGTTLISADGAESVMQSNAIDEIYFGEVFSVEHLCREIDRVTATDVRRVARKIFGDRKRSILVYGPSPSQAVRKALKPKFPRR
jgi:predicted Zn-dependent peptidase